MATQKASESHTASHLRSRLENIAASWGLSSKVVCVVTDNGANIVAAVNSLTESYAQQGLWKHTPCVAHTLNLAVLQAIEGTLFLPRLIAKCKNVVTFFKSSGPAMAAIVESCSNDDRFVGKKVKQDVSTRWNSTLIMLRSFHELRSKIVSSLDAVSRPDLMLTLEE